jgi:hypothetical protein
MQVIEARTIDGERWHQIHYTWEQNALTTLSTVDDLMDAMSREENKVTPMPVARDLKARAWQALRDWDARRKRAA